MFAEMKATLPTSVELRGAAGRWLGGAGVASLAIGGPRIWRYLASMGLSSFTSFSI